MRGRYNFILFDITIYGYVRFQKKIKIRHIGVTESRQIT